MTITSTPTPTALFFDTLLQNYGFETIPFTLKERMQEYLTTYNSKCFNPYNTHVISLKSKKILKFLNFKNTFIQKINEFKIHNEILVCISKKLYKEFNPTLIYCFNDEIHLVFADCEKEESYNGNINKKLSCISTFASVLFTKEFLKQEIDLDFCIIPKYVEFKKDVQYELLNYIIWRQNDCLRNNLTTLYSYFEKNLDNISIPQIAHALTNYPESTYITDQIMYGNLIKNDECDKSRGLFVENIHLTTLNFSKNMKKYIKIE